MPYLEELMKKAKSEVEAPKISFVPSEGEGEAGQAGAGEERIIIDSYGEVKVYKQRGEPLLLYEVPSPRYRGEEKALVEAILDISARTIRVDEALFQTKSEKRAKYFHDVRQIIDGTPELKIPPTSKDFYANAVVREMVGFGLVDPLIADDRLEEVMVIGVNTPVYVFHRKYEMMKTNIVFYDNKDIVDLIEKIARNVGRRIDIASPLLDARLPDGTRVNATIQPISLNGSTLTLRKFKADPYSIIDLVNNNTLNYEVAAFLWMLVDGMGGVPANIIVAGATASGKTTLLNVLTSFMPNYERMISIEDSVDGNEEIIVFENQTPRRTTIGELVDGAIQKHGARLTEFGHEICENFDRLETQCFDKSGKIVRKAMGSLIRHKTNKPMFEVILRSGRRLKLTEDHNLFSLDENCEISAAKTSELRPGTFVATPRSLELGEGGRPYTNLLKYLDQLKGFVCGGKISSVLRGRSNKELCAFAKGRTHAGRKAVVNNWRGKGILPCKVFSELMRRGYFSEEDAGELCLTTGKNNRVRVPVILELDEDFLKLVGLWLADGCYDQNSVIISVDEPEIIVLLERVAARFGAKVKKHSDDFSAMIHSSLLKQIMREALELEGDSLTKRMPSWTIELSKKQIGALLNGYFSGDGTVSKFEVEWTSCSEKLMQDVQTLLLRIGIIGRVGKLNKITRSKKSVELGYGNTQIIYRKGRVSGYFNLALFKNSIGFCSTKKQARLSGLTAKGAATHDSTDVVPVPAAFLKASKSELGADYRNYYAGNTRIGRRHLAKLVQRTSHDKLGALADSDIFWDEVREITPLAACERTVYDLSVPSHENFVCSNIFVHNTAEIRLPFSHWIRLETRPPGLEGAGEIAMNDLLKNALRMRPDRIVVGEIRGDEGYTLFSAMNTGHNGSMGTLHSNTAKETLVRLSNPPMNVPLIMLHALNFVVMMQRVYDRRKGFIRRVSEIAEIVGTDEAKMPEMNVLYKWNPAEDALQATGEPPLFFKNISNFTGLGREAILEELKAREQVLRDLNQRGVRELDAVCKVTQDYAQRKQGKI